MTSKNKKNIAINEKKNQQNLRNKAMEMGVTLKAPETVIFIKGYKIWKKCCYKPLCSHRKKN